MKLNSIVFHTDQLEKIRGFYEGELELPTGTYVKNGQTVPDYSESYINYHIGGALLCFEADATKTDVGTVILNVKDFEGLRARLDSKGVPIVVSSKSYFKIEDPDGRTIILEPYPNPP
jgi:hypothetical protein